MAKITYGLKNLYYAKITVGEGGTVSYGTPVALKGAKSLDLSATGENTIIYADDSQYVNISAGAGYEGNFTVLNLPDSFLKDILGMTADSNGVLIENEDDVASQFALIGEFKTETETRKRFVLYNCSATKPNFGGETQEDGVEAHEYEVEITCAPASDTGNVKASCTNDTATKTQFDAWLTAVYVG